MSFNRDGYYYDQQLKRHILQFMAIFTDLQVQIGKWNDKDERLTTVPIHYAAPDRVVGAIMQDNTQNKPLSLPVMSAYMHNLELARDLMHGTGVERRTAFVPVGGLVPDDIKVVRQRMAVPYRLEMELGIYASNTDQHFQILEQILPLFEPQLTVQVSDGVLDPGRLTSVELNRVNVDSNYPVGADRRIVQSTLSFSMIIYLQIPSEVRTDYVKRVLYRIAAVDSLATDSFEIVGDIDSQGIPYRDLLNSSNLPID